MTDLNRAILRTSPSKEKKCEESDGAITFVLDPQNLHKSTEKKAFKIRFDDEHALGR